MTEWKYTATLQEMLQNRGDFVAACVVLTLTAKILLPSTWYALLKEHKRRTFQKNLQNTTVVELPITERIIFILKMTS